jgi:hypothetical protein
MTRSSLRLFRHVERGEHRAVDAVKDGLAVGGGLAPAKRNADERHIDLLLS